MAQPGCQRLGRGGNICEENTCFSQFSSRVLAPVQWQGEFAAIYEAFLQKGSSTSAATGGLGEVTGPGGAGGGSSGNGEEQENPGLDGGAARELPTQLARADGGQSRHLPACGLGGRGLRGAVGLPPPTRRDPPGDLTHSSHHREGQACVPNPAATISAQEFWEMG